jgi:hypothetical protein
MESKPIIGVVGGYGAVGQATSRLLYHGKECRLRIGGRRPELARLFVNKDLDGCAEIMAVDVYDRDSLLNFCKDCHIIVNCAGPSFHVLDRVARVAFACGADYVDPGGDDPLYLRLAEFEFVDSGRRSVLSAGIMPGLTMLLPRALAGAGFDRVSGLTAYIGLRDHLTKVGAADYLLSLGGGFGESLAAWRGGARVSRALEPLAQVELPFFPGRVNAHPYLSRETERLARAIGLVEVSWYSVFDGKQMMFALGQLQGSMIGEGDLATAATALARAAELDLFGTTPYQLLVFHLDGEANGRPTARIMILHAVDTYELTGTVSAMVVTAILKKEMPLGLHFAADVLDPNRVLEQLGHCPAVKAIEIIDDAESGLALEEGIL